MYLLTDEVEKIVRVYVLKDKGYYTRVPWDLAIDNIM